MQNLLAEIDHSQSTFACCVPFPYDCAESGAESLLVEWSALTLFAPLGHSSKIIELG
jgi:hypothetical protein